MHPLVEKELAAYLRVSSDEQDTTRQKQSIKHWAAHNGLTIKHWFIDEHGRNPRDKADKRLNFQRLLTLIRTGTIDAVIVDSQDRFGVKDAYEFGKYVSELRDHGCELWSVGQGHLSGEDDASVLTSTIGAMTSKREQSEKGLRSLEGKLQTAREGRWSGGPAPYGCDVVCYDQSGKEKWRLVWEAKEKRLRINPDGSTKRYDGKGNVPARDKTDLAKLQPSVRKERIRIVRQIFNWYANESISPKQIATRLRLAGVDPLYTDWEHTRVQDMLANPVYIGRPASNKHGNSRYYEFVDGKIQRVLPIKGKIKTGRYRSRNDFVYSESEIFPPIVPVELFNKVQEKYDRNFSKHRADASKRRKQNSPRVASYWLRNLAYCGNCNKPLRCWNAYNGDTVYRNYCCGTYATVGPHNKTGCRVYKVRADLLESMVLQYLGEAHATIAKLLSEKTPDTMEQIDPLYEGTTDEFVSTLQEMEQFISKHKPKKLPSHLVRAVKGFRHAFTQELAIYDFVFENRRVELEKRYKELDNKHSALIKKYEGLPPTATVAIEKIKRDILAIEPELGELAEEMQNRGERFRELIQELLQRGKAIETIRKTVSTDGEYRRRSQLVGTVIDKVICHFRNIKPTGKKLMKQTSEFESMEVVPRIDTFPNGKSPATGR